MSADSLERLLTRLEAAKNQFGRGAATEVEGLLKALARRRFTDAPSLLRFHESLLFLRAFPQGPGVVHAAEKLLDTFHLRTQALHASGADMSLFEEFDGSGVAGATMQDTLSFDVTRWLARRIPSNVEVAWDDYEDGRAMASIWPRLMPLLEEDSNVEADVPWKTWLRTAKGRGITDLEWFLQRFEQLPVSDQEKAVLYDAMRLPIRWRLRDLRFSRTRNRRPVRDIYYHREPLITRREVSLASELARAGPVLKRLPLREGRAIMDLIREVMAVRYRELYGTTLGDPRSVVRAELGRGVVIYLWNLPGDRRLPLRAYVAGLTLKNGVPINYIEAIGLCEWLEIGFNTFYTFRNGETAWVYAQALRCICRLTRARCISIYPYQIGHDNDEAIESGAFWFYRKLGFRPGRKELLRLTEREEEKMAARAGYRTPPRVLRRLAEGHIFYELPGSEIGAWDSFAVRNLGLRVNRQMAEAYGGDSARIRQASTAKVSKALGIQAARWNALERRCLENWSLVLALVPDVARWPAEEKRAMVAIIRAQAARNEMRYLRLTQRHDRLRKALLWLGSNLR